MAAIADVASEFLSHRRVAITGVSRSSNDHGANFVYKRFKERGYEVYPVNPNAKAVEGDVCYPDLKSIPGGVELVIIGTRPEHATQTMRECGELGITRVWMHRAFGQGSCSPEAAVYGRNHGMTVIEGGCPLMFGPTADVGHKVMRFFLSFGSAVPREA
ncbi:MAG TPA: CoA-binding protein [Candidatus Limnocylindrales bacterium]|nr:CoA-binding protein [Candidatus Limnocylindrales bacterium]